VRPGRDPGVGVGNRYSRPACRRVQQIWKKGDSKAEKVPAGGKLIAVAEVRITQARREALGGKLFGKYPPAEPGALV